jgi:hypothetical protein
MYRPLIITCKAKEEHYYPPFTPLKAAAISADAARLKEEGQTREEYYMRLRASMLRSRNRRSAKKKKNLLPPW